MNNMPSNDQIERIATQPPPDPKIIKKHIDAAMSAKLLTSRLIAGIVCGGIGAYITAVKDFTGLGANSIAWIGGACFLVGFLVLGERIAFVALGVLIGKLWF